MWMDGHAAHEGVICAWIELQRHDSRVKYTTALGGTALLFCSHSWEGCVSLLVNVNERLLLFAPAGLMITLSAVLMITAVTTSPTRNVLYIVYDDLRPDLSAYDVPFMKGKTPNIQKLADTGTLFERAYAQVAVCSPSRNSFATGRRPNSTKVWNFINHFRNAECATKNEIKIVGTVMPGGFIGGKPEQPAWVQPASGGFAQCCTLCVAADGCAGWTYKRNNCTLFSEVASYEACPSGQPLESSSTCVSGEKGEFPVWTPLPAHFRSNGYMVLGSGKYYHPGGHSGIKGSASHPEGAGTPPMADRNLSWTPAGYVRRSLELERP